MENEVFYILYQNKIIDEEMAKKLKSMVGFRNIAVHDYQKINLDIIKQIIEKHLKDLKDFAEKILML